MELGRWFKTWVDQNHDGSDYNDSEEVEGWLGVELKVDTLTVVYEPATETGQPGPRQTEYYRVTRIAEPPSSHAQEIHTTS